MKKFFKQFTTYTKLFAFTFAVSIPVALFYFSPTPASALCNFTGEPGFPSEINSFSVSLGANDLLSVNGTYKKGGECMQKGMYHEGTPQVVIANTGLSSAPVTTNCISNCAYRPKIDVSSLQNGTYEAIFSVDDQWGGAKPRSANVTINRTTTGIPTASLSVTPSTIPLGGRATLTWSSTNATSCTAGGLWSNAGKLSGSGLTDPLNSNTTFTFLCSGPGGVSSLQSVTATISQGTPVVPNDAPLGPVVRISVSPATITNSGSTNIAWLATNVTQGCVASDAWSGAQQESGTFRTPTLSPGTYIYTLSCTGNLGKTISASVKVIVTKGKVVTNFETPPAPVVQIFASPAKLKNGDSAVITWDASNVTQGCNAYGDWSGAKPESGAFRTAPLSTGTYKYALSCTGGLGRRGSGSVEVTVAVGAPTVSVFASPASVVVGGSALLKWSTMNATSCIASGDWGVQNLYRVKRHFQYFQHLVPTDIPLPVWDQEEYGMTVQISQ